MITIRIAVGLLGCALIVTETAGAGPVDPAMVSHTCAGCHGTLGASLGDAPVIAGLPEQYFLETMLNYKTGSRYSTIMGRLAKGYSQAEIEAMARFFAAQPWTTQPQQTDPAQVERGKELHTSRACAACHGPDGTPSAPNPAIPSLSGQFAEYLVTQLEDYRDPGTAIPPAALPMRAMVQGLTDKDFRALGQFYASQQPPAANEQ